MTSARRLAFSLAGTLLAASACSGGTGIDSEELREPSSRDFAPVAETLVLHCGTLDCHGMAGRNLRLYGASGQRLDPKDVPGGRETTAAEVLADYRSTIGLEPEVLAEVFASRGAGPERLTLIRKARGTENHKGNKPFPKDSNGDKCLVSFVAGAVDVASCNNSKADP